MTEWMRKVLESKRRARSRLTEMSFAEKVRVLEKLRDRSVSIQRTSLGRRSQSASGDRS